MCRCAAVCADRDLLQSSANLEACLQIDTSTQKFQPALMTWDQLLTFTTLFLPVSSCFEGK